MEFNQPACDDSSERGHFGWSKIVEEDIPYIIRSAEKYCSVRILRMKLVNKFSKLRRRDIYIYCTRVKTHSMSKAEARLMNEINFKHCNSQFGRDLFKLEDAMILLSEALEFFQFLDICYQEMFMNKNKLPSDKCGFIRVNNCSEVPYVTRDGQKYLPLMYFDSDYLRLRAEVLSGWGLSYLKLCCRIHGVRNELFDNDFIAVINLTEVKSYFPPSTIFDDCCSRKRSELKRPKVIC